MCTFVQALRLCTGRTAHKGSRGIALLFLGYGTRRRWGVSVTPRPLLTPGKDPVPIVQEAEWAQGRPGHVRKISPPPGFDPRTVQPVASRYTDWATRPTRSRVCCLHIQGKWIASVVHLRWSHFFRNVGKYVCGISLQKIVVSETAEKTWELAYLYICGLYEKVCTKCWRAVAEYMGVRKATVLCLSLVFLQRSQGLPTKHSCNILHSPDVLAVVL